ncbi:MAG: 4-alpha-glucanotransferase [Spirochaetaceae bacterium]|jgi:4-alpha-glucanotransferase|nr:4-alpha-glucanotransferase [Spirochaetaceae bacterium]
MTEISTNKRLLGLVVPVGALRSMQSAGTGEFADIVELAHFAKKLGLGLIQLLPVNDTGYESSPYFALTAFGLNPIYMRIGAIPEAADFKSKIEALRDDFEKKTRFPYYQVAKAKISLLRDIYDANRASIEKDAALGKWITANKWVVPYAVYRALKDEHEMKSWREWHSSRHLTSKEIDALWNNSGKRSAHIFWAWIQYHLDMQFQQAAREVEKLGIILEGDLPILMNEDSSDVWAHPELFNQNLSAGAPPDMYSPAGQNWGFPIYNWKAHEDQNFEWWKERLAVAARYYKAYRIDHVLGFFRIWATDKNNVSAALGRYVESVPVRYAELKALGYDAGRIRWVTEPHIPTNEVWDAVQRAACGNENEVRHVFDTALERIGDEELWLFKKSITCEKDILALDIHSAAKNYLTLAWSNRIFMEIRDGGSNNTAGAAEYAPLWYYKTSRAYTSLTNGEKAELDKFIEKKKTASEKIWKTQGDKLLGVLAASSSMLPCAEDLGAVPECVPKTLAKLKILGLRVTRWHREWNKEGTPYVPFAAYPELSVCTPAVHDSSTVREWWEREASQDEFAHFIGAPSLPRVYNPGTARTVLKAIAQAASRFRVFQIQDLLHLSPRWYAEDAASERINVPGTNNEFNWTWRLPATICEIADDTELVNAVKELAAVKKTTKK